MAAYNSPIPQLGLGTFGRTGDAGVAAMLKAIEIGYRHIDTEQNYDTERPVGEAIRRSGVPRRDVFVTTKIGDQNLAEADFLPSVEKSLETLGLEQVDLLLIHWPSQGDAEVLVCQRVTTRQRSSPARSFRTTTRKPRVVSIAPTLAASVAPISMQATPPGAKSSTAAMRR